MSKEKLLKLHELAALLDQADFSSKHSLELLSGVIYYDQDDDDVWWPTDRLKFNPKRIDLSDKDHLVALGSGGVIEYLCKVTKNRRHKRFSDVIGDPRYSGPHIVSEGDSWFLYPVLIDETIDQLLLTNQDALAIWSLGCAGDTLEEMEAENEHWDYTYWNRPDIMLLSGGGNDILGGGNLYYLLNRYSVGDTASDLINKRAYAEIDLVVARFSAIFAKMNTSFPSVRIITHGYDYPVPKNDIWIEKPLRRRRIPKRLWKSVIKVMFDHYNKRLASVCASHANAQYVDLRGTVRSSKDWFDEIHPTSKGFKKIAKKIRAAV
ncbi:MAG: hypothetical protein K0U93_00260 [Gammaproteobacteria bacterium]|nr:hypothetical protein [Gammaproteobacteria bacterium]